MRLLIILISGLSIQALAQPAAARDHYRHHGWRLSSHYEFSRMGVPYREARKRTANAQRGGWRQTSGAEGTSWSEPSWTQPTWSQPSWNHEYSGQNGWSYEPSRTRPAAQ